MLSKALINNEISHEYVTKNVNEKRNYRELEESTRMMKSQRSDL